VATLAPVRDGGAQPGRDAVAASDEPDTAPTGDAAGADAAPAATDGGGVARDAGDGGAKRPVNPTIARPRLVRIVPDPPTAKVVVDDRDHGEYGSELAKGIALEPGNHQVVFVPVERPDDECRYDRLEVQLFVPPDAPEGELLRRTYSLPFRPAAVLISSKAPGATVSVQGRARWPANEVFRFRLNECRERMTLLVNADGFRPVALEDVVLESGGEYSRAVTLEPEAQSAGLENSATP
jgi:hypothetical protein